MKYNPYIHHRRSIRLKGYDYSQGGAYFVTLCVQNRKCLFGEIINGEMQLHKRGQIIQKYWMQINKRFPHVKLDHFIVMPNHFHGIIIINDHVTCRGEVTSPLSSLGNIIAWFKYQSTKHINNIRQTPGVRLWQRNYFERIIRNEKIYNRIIKYITNNPIMWDPDKENPMI